MSNPDLMLSDVSQNIMRQIFHGDLIDFQKDLLKIFLLLLQQDQLQSKGISHINV